MHIPFFTLQLWYNGLITFDAETLELFDIFYSPQPIPLEGDLEPYSVVSPYWAHGEFFTQNDQTFQYTGTIRYEIHTEDTEAMRNVTNYIRDQILVTSEYRGLTFEPVAMLAVEWNISRHETFGGVIEPGLQVRFVCT